MPSDLGGDVKVIYSTYYAFAALKGDGTVRAWGGGGSGGTVPSDLGGDVKVIYSTSKAFAALKGDGTVRAWGDVRYGGTVPSGLSGVKAISSTCLAFAALKEDETVEVWGSVWYGEAAMRAPSDLGGDVKVIYSTMFAFAALKGDGTVRAWGTDASMGNMSPPSGLSDVSIIFGSTLHYSDSTSMHHYPCPPGYFGLGMPDCEACPEGAPVAPAQRRNFTLGIRSVKGSCVTCPSPTFSEDGVSCGDTCANGFTYYAPTYFGDTASGCHACVWARAGTYYDATT